MIELLTVLASLAFGVAVVVLAFWLAEVAGQTRREW